jgi:ring-1,2-phenylacetyl-CoA epoxidase subunit PaaE
MAHPRFHRLRIASLQPETSQAVTISFDVPSQLASAYRFTPGQYLTLRATIDGEDIRRSYSICAAPEDNELRVAIKHVEGGAFSTWVNAALREGDEISVMTPDGRFHLPPPDAAAAVDGRLLVALAAGSGITPVLSILKAALRREPASRFVLFYGNRTTESIMFRQQLEDLKDRHMSRLSVFHVLSREQQDIPVLNGHLDAAKVALLMRTMVPFAAIDQAFICGPQPMIEGLEKTLADLGLARDRIHVERFTPGAGGRPRPALVTPAAAPKAVATVISEGARWDIPVAEGEAVIDAAIRAGRSLPYSCKGGMCCTCRAKLLEGKVEMTMNYSLEPWETDAGFILTCQSHPLTERVVIDYDQV